MSVLLNEANDVIGGFWGNAIHYTRLEQFDKGGLAERKTFSVHGWKPADQRLEIGSTIAAEFQRSWVLFRVESIRYCSDPKDMFFAEVAPIKQETKSTT